MLPFSTHLQRNLRAISHELWRDGKGWILITVAAGWLLSVGVRYIYPSVLPFFRAEFEFDLMIAGLLLSALWLAYAFGQFPGGVLGDRYGEGTILAVSTSISAIAIFMVAIALNLWILFVATIIFGFATALYGTTRFTIFTDIYTDRAGTAVGLTMAAGSIGNTVLPAIAATIATYLSWRLGFGILVPIFIGVTIALWVAVPKRTSQSQPSDPVSIETMRSVVSSITIGGIPIVVSIHIILAFVNQGLLGFYPTYLVEVKGFTPQIAAILFGSYFAFGIVVQPLTGVVRDRFGSRTTLAIIASMYALGLFALQLGETVVHFLLLTVLLSHRNGLGVVTNTHIADVLPDELKGSGLGLLRTSWQLIGALSPIFVGYLGAIGQLNVAFLVLAVIALVASVLTLFVPRT